MTASVPSKMALATSLASARVGRGFSIIDSSICVAVITGLRLFPFGGYGDVSLVSSDDLLGGLHVGGGADKGEGHGVNPMGESELKILAVLCSESRNGQRHAGQIDALVFAQQAAVQYL